MSSQQLLNLGQKNVIILRFNFLTAFRLAQRISSHTRGSASARFKPGATFGGYVSAAVRVRSHEVRPQITFMVKKNNIYSVTVQTAALFSEQPSVPLKADQFKVFARKMNAVISHSEWPVCRLYGAYTTTRAIKKKCKKKNPKN